MSFSVVFLFFLVWLVFCRYVIGIRNSNATANHLKKFTPGFLKKTVLSSAKTEWNEKALHCRRRTWRICTE